VEQAAIDRALALIDQFNPAQATRKDLSDYVVRSILSGGFAGSVSPNAYDALPSAFEAAMQRLRMMGSPLRSAQEVALAGEIPVRGGGLHVPSDIPIRTTPEVLQPPMAPVAEAASSRWIPPAQDLYQPALAARGRLTPGEKLTGAGLGAAGIGAGALAAMRGRQQQAPPFVGVMPEVVAEGERPAVGHNWMEELQALGLEALANRIIEANRGAEVPQQAAPAAPAGVARGGGVAQARTPVVPLAVPEIEPRPYNAKMAETQNPNWPQALLDMQLRGSRYGEPETYQQAGPIQQGQEEEGGRERGFLGLPDWLLPLASVAGLAAPMLSMGMLAPYLGTLAAVPGMVKERKRAEEREDLDTANTLSLIGSRAARVQYQQRRSQQIDESLAKRMDPVSARLMDTITSPQASPELVAGAWDALYQHDPETANLFLEWKRLNQAQIDDPLTFGDVTSGIESGELPVSDLKGVPASLLTHRMPEGAERQAQRVALKTTPSGRAKTTKVDTKAVALETVNRYNKEIREAMSLPRAERLAAAKEIRARWNMDEPGVSAYLKDSVLSSVIGGIDELVESGSPAAIFLAEDGTIHSFDQGDVDGLVSQFLTDVAPSLRDSSDDDVVALIDRVVVNRPEGMNEGRLRNKLRAAMTAMGFRLAGYR
jgi:hypothetical protein